MISKVLRKLRTLYRLVLEYKDLGSLTVSLMEYYRLKNSRSHKRIGRRLLVHRLPHGLFATTISEPQYLRAYVTAFDEIYIMKVYERLSDFVPNEEDVVLDLGAFIGLYTLKHFKALQIFTAEPHPISYSLLIANVKLNELENVKCLNYAIWSYSTTMAMYEEDFLVSSSALISEWHKDYHRKQILVKTTTLDELMDQGIISRCIDVAKVDIEGAEVHFINGGIEALSQGCIGRLVMELHKTVVNPKTVYAKLRELGFCIVYRLQGYDTEIVYAKHVK
uniref:FkbM family methyltransferase n=1 Tax=Ignisphaera aggregans TaxID=334771 RepID=A0A7J3YTW3_9CREN